MAKNRNRTAKHYTVELYPENGWDVDKIKKILDEHSIVKQYVAVLHDKDVNTDATLVKPHYYVYINFGRSSATREDVARWFDIRETLVENVKTNKRKAIRYAIHLDQPEKHQYSKDEVVANFDFTPFLSNEKPKTVAQVEKERKERIVNDCAAGIITPYNYLQYIEPTEYANWKTLITRAWEVYEHTRLIASEGQRKCDVIWICGESGTGKTTIAKLMAKELGLSTYVTATGMDPFSNYCGQGCAILDDIRPNYPFSYNDLLKILDPHYNVPVQSRYRNKMLFADKIFICTILPLEQFYEGYGFGAMDDAKQLYRRISEIWEVTENEIAVYTHSDKFEFERTEVRANPVPLYLRQQQEQTNHDEAEAFYSIISKYMTFDDVKHG